MTNTDRLAQANDVAERLERGISQGSGCFADIYDAAKTIRGLSTALASLAPIAVEGEFLNIANDCRAVASMKMLSVSARARLILAAEIVEKSSAQVAALTAQCASDKALLDSQRIVIKSYDEFGEPCRTLHVGIDLRAAITAGNGEGV